MFVQNLIHQAATKVVSKGNQEKNILQIKTNKPQLPLFEALRSKDFKCGNIRPGSSVISESGEDRASHCSLDKRMTQYRGNRKQPKQAENGL